ncbi:hypothetical protein PENTCL1PPCAC_24701, partial [Pristionchus entomophagus]
KGLFQEPIASADNWIVGESLFFFDILDSTYRTCHHFPEDRGIRLCGYTVYCRETELEKFFEDCTDNIDRQNLVRELVKWTKQIEKCVRQYFESTQPTNVEFIALFGLTLWKDEIINHNECLIKTASRIRSEILNELHIYYKMRETEDYASRIELFYDFARRFQVMRLMHMFENVW